MEKRLYDLDENGPFSTVLPPLTDAEDGRLKASLLKDGCIDAIVTWNGVIVDGHNRYRLCKTLGIPFETKEMEFESEAEARLWLIDHQLGRRNVPAFVKIELVLPYEPMLREEAKKRQGTRNDLNHLLATLPASEENKGTRKIMAEMAGVGERSIPKVKYLLENANQDLLTRLRQGDIAIHTAFKMTEWCLEVADEFTRYRIQKGVITLEKAYDEYKEREREEVERLKAQAGQDSHEDQEDDEWDEEGDYDPTFGGKVVPLFPTREAITPSAGQRVSLVAGGYIGGFTQNNRAQMNTCPQQKKGEIVSIIPYLKARGWTPEDNALDEDASNDAGDEPDDSPKAEIISIIPYLKARGRLPMDYEEPDEDVDDDYGEEEYDSNDQYDVDDDIEGEDDADEHVAHKQCVVNIADIKVCDPKMPIPKGCVSLMGPYMGEAHGNGGSYEEDAMRLIRTEEGSAPTISFDMILSAMERVSHDFENNVAVLLSVVATEDRTAENGIRVNNILNDCLAAVIDKYTEVF